MAAPSQVIRPKGHVCRKINARLEEHFQVCCTTLMAEPKEKNRTKDIVLWIITVLLVALAIFWYQKPR